jgi:hypothetical protein
VTLVRAGPRLRLRSLGSTGSSNPALRARATAALLGLLWWASAGGCGGGTDTEAPAPAAGRFVAVGSGVSRDTRTGLEWTRRDHDRALAWQAASRYCETLVLEGRTDWRLPEIAELQALYDDRIERPCGDRTCRLDALIELKGPYVWSATQSGSSRRFYIDFHFGTTLAPNLKPTLLRHVLCVHPPTP